MSTAEIDRLIARLRQGAKGRGYVTMSEMAAAAAALAALKADAERWTLFRDRWCDVDDVAFHMCIVDAATSAELDAAVDAARAEKL